MPRDVNGVYTLPEGPLAPAVAGAGPITAAAWNTLMADIATALSRSAFSTGATVTLDSDGVTLAQIIATIGYLKLNSESAEDEARLDLNPKAAATSPARVRCFRDVTTSGIRAFEVLRGDGTDTLDHQLRAGVNADSSLLRAGGKLAIGGVDPQVTVDITGTDAVQLVRGTTAQRPTATTVGRVRFNTTLGTLEVSDGSAWQSVGSVSMTLGQNSVVVYSSGLIHQFGQFGGGNATNPLTGTFPLQFPTACRSVTCTALAYSTNQAVVATLGGQPTTTGFTVYRHSLGGADRDTAVHWDAWGN